MIEVWTKWEGQVVNGVFPLRRVLSASDHSAVFLTDYKSQNLPDAALKLVPAIPTLAQTQLSHWTAAAKLSHPHLIRLFEVGRCQLGDLEFLFVVMEYAEQTLSQILPQRALTSGEAREMLLPTLNALAFLHGKTLVQGQLKPSNLLVVNDQLKLASDSIRPAGESSAYLSKSSAYDPPEAKDGGFSASGDVWSLGITLVEALTQCLPTWPESTSEIASLPAALPPEFMEIARQCLNRNPANRPTVADLEAQINPAPPSPPAAPPSPPAQVPQPPVHEVADSTPARRGSPLRSRLVPAIAVVLIVVAVWAGMRVLGSRSSVEVAAPATVSQPESSPPAAPEVSDQHAPPLPSRLPSVLHEEIPNVSQGARRTIRGRIKISVRVTIDRAGNVVDEALEKRGPSRYFARLATEAARKWKFAPAENQDSRKMLLRFEFSRSGATGHAVTSRS